MLTTASEVRWNILIIILAFLANKSISLETNIRILPKFPCDVSNRGEPSSSAARAIFFEGDPID